MASPMMPVTLGRYTAIKKACNTLAGHSGFQQDDTADMRGRLVTGSTKGIGFEVARAFALSCARVLLLSSSADNGGHAIAEIHRTVSEAANVRFIECDLGNLAAVERVADSINQDEERQDIMQALDADIDRHLAIGHLGHFLLINRLLSLVRHTSKIPGAPPPRIVSLSSVLHRQAPSTVRFTSAAEVTADGSRDMSALVLYARVKLANILFTKYTLVARAITPADDDIYALATHPGAVHAAQQEQLKDAYGPLCDTLLKAITTPLMRPPEHGSLSTLWAATSEDIEKNA